MDRWEYITEVIRNFKDVMTVDELNSRGNVGWELVSVRDTSNLSSNIFLKEKSD